MDISIIGGADGPTSVFLAGKIGDVFILPAYMILILFYGIYFVKMLSQKRQGIQTNQLGKGKNKSVRSIETKLRLMTWLIGVIQVLSVVLDWNRAAGAVRVTGVIIGGLGDLVFLIAVLTMKNSWRAGIPEKDRTQLISNGIYRYSRNPAFLGFDLMYIGILLICLNGLLFCVTVCGVVLLHLQILQEEKYLTEVFGEEYIRYQRCVRRYFGRKQRI